MNDYIEHSWNNPRDCHHDYVFPIVLKILQKLKLSKDSLMLDAGCGGGYVIGELYKRGYKNVWGFDASLSGINVAKKNYNDLMHRLYVYNAYNKNLPEPFPKNNYAIILSIEILEHLYNPIEYLKNVNYWLKQDGVFIISTPYHGYIKNLAIALANRFDKHLDPSQVGGHIKLFSKMTLFKILKDNGIRPSIFYGGGRMPLMWKSMVIVGRK